MNWKNIHPAFLCFTGGVFLLLLHIFICSGLLKTYPEESHDVLYFLFSLFLFFVTKVFFVFVIREKFRASLLFPFFATLISGFLFAVYSIFNVFHAYGTDYVFIGFLTIIELWVFRSVVIRFPLLLVLLVLPIFYFFQSIEIKYKGMMAPLLGIQRVDYIDVYLLWQLGYVICLSWALVFIKWEKPVSIKDESAAIEELLP
jgi:hypothetical protein